MLKKINFFKKKKTVKMLKFIINVYALFLLFDNYQITKAQINLSKSNLDSLCNCKSSQSYGMNLNNKSISTNDQTTFNGLTSIRELWLSNNQLTSLHLLTFSGLNLLQTLLLSNNQLATINYLTFNGLTSLRELNLDSNNYYKFLFYLNKTKKNVLSLYFILHTAS